MTLCGGVGGADRNFLKFFLPSPLVVDGLSSTRGGGAARGRKFLSAPPPPISRKSPISGGQKVKNRIFGFQCHFCGGGGKCIACPPIFFSGGGITPPCSPPFRRPWYIDLSQGNNWYQWKEFSPP